MKIIVLIVLVTGVTATAIYVKQSDSTPPGETAQTSADNTGEPTGEDGGTLTETPSTTDESGSETPSNDSSTDTLTLDDETSGTDTQNTDDTSTSTTEPDSGFSETTDSSSGALPGEETSTFDHDTEDTSSEEPGTNEPGFSSDNQFGETSKESAKTTRNTETTSPNKGRNESQQESRQLTSTADTETSPSRTSQEQTGGPTTSTSTSSSSSEWPKTHTVQSGENPWVLSKKYYGAGHHWKAILRANPEIPSANALKEGMELTIPRIDAVASSSDTGSEETSERAAQPGTRQGNEYVVQKGDRLWNIVKEHYGSATLSKVQKLARVNNIQPNQLKPGMTISLPPDLFSGSPSGSGSTTSAGGSDRDGSDEGPPFQAGPNQEWYQLKKGESLWEVSKKQYGTGTHYQDIWQANQDRLANPDAIRAGTWLLIPKNP